MLGRVSGRVIVEGTQTPVADANVFVVVDGGLGAPAAPLPSTVTDGDGRYRFDILPPGRYRIAAQKSGFAPPMEPSTMQMVEVFDDQVLDDLTVFLRRGGAIAGRIVDPRGQPLAEVAVTALLKRLNSRDQSPELTSAGAPLLVPFGRSQTDGFGEFRILGLSPGEYVVAANPRPDSGGTGTSASAATTLMTTFFPGTAEVSEAQPVTVQEAETLSDLAIRLVTAPVFQVSGVVVNEDGVPVADAMVMLMGDRGGANPMLFLDIGPRGMCQSDAIGRFVFCGVPAGSYTLQAVCGGLGFFSGFADFIIDGAGTPRTGPDRSKPEPVPGTVDVTVENGNVSNLTLVVSGPQ